MKVVAGICDVKFCKHKENVLGAIQWVSIVEMKASRKFARRIPKWERSVGRGRVSIKTLPWGVTHNSSTWVFTRGGRWYHVVCSVAHLLLYGRLFLFLSQYFAQISSSLFLLMPCSHESWVMTVSSLSIEESCMCYCVVLSRSIVTPNSSSPILFDCRKYPSLSSKRKWPKSCTNQSVKKRSPKFFV